MTQSEGTPLHAAQERARRRAEVFGEVLPEATTDDADAGPEHLAGSEDWLHSNVPPHHA